MVSFAELSSSPGISTASKQRLILAWIGAFICGVYEANYFCIVTSERGFVL